VKHIDLVEVNNVPKCLDCGRATVRVPGPREFWGCVSCQIDFKRVRAVEDLDMTDDENGVYWVGYAYEMGLDPSEWPESITLKTFDGSKETFRLDGASADSASYLGTFKGEDVIIRVESR
jgi:hypothetical protein